MLDQVGGIGAAVDAALPAVVFALVYALSGRSLAAAIWSSLAVAVAVLLFRVVRRDPVRNAVGGLFAVAVAAGIAALTGNASDYYVVSLGRSAFLLLFYAGSCVFRYPVIGLVVGAARGAPTAFRSDPGQLRAYTGATWIWVGLFGLRLAVRVPLYFGNSVGWLAATDVFMGWPLFALTVVATFFYLRRALHADLWRDAEAAIIARRPGARKVLAEVDPHTVARIPEPDAAQSAGESDSSGADRVDGTAPERDRVVADGAADPADRPVS